MLRGIPVSEGIGIGKVFIVGGQAEAECIQLRHYFLERFSSEVSDFHHFFLGLVDQIF